jgi:glycerol-3-phosphate acyltransferase PlsX
MGADIMPSVIFHAALAALKQLKNTQLVFFVSEKVKRSLQSKKLSSLISFQSYPQIIEMDESPLQSVRKKKQSSLVQGVQAVQRKEIDAFMSCANTGALVAASWLFLPPYAGIKRPALVAELPTMNGSMIVLDVGGIVRLKREDFVQTALLGIRYHLAKFGEKLLKVGFLNIGAEEGKGPEELKAAFSDLKRKSKEDASFQFVGNVEGTEVFSGKVDVLITDGFSGNIFLKTTEGASSFVLEYVKRRFQEEGLSEALVQSCAEKLHGSASQGALILGIDGYVMKCHGSSSPWAITQAIIQLRGLLQKGFISRMKRYF